MYKKIIIGVIVGLLLALFFACLFVSGFQAGPVPLVLFCDIYTAICAYLIHPEFLIEIVYEVLIAIFADGSDSGALIYNSTKYSYHAN